MANGFCRRPMVLAPAVPAPSPRPPRRLRTLARITVMVFCLFTRLSVEYVPDPFCGPPAG